MVDKEYAFKKFEEAVNAMLEEAVQQKDISGMISVGSAWMDMFDRCVALEKGGPPLFQPGFVSSKSVVEEEDEYEYDR